MLPAVAQNGLALSKFLVRRMTVLGRAIIRSVFFDYGSHRSRSVVASEACQDSRHLVSVDDALALCAEDVLRLQRTCAALAVEAFRGIQDAANVNMANEGRRCVSNAASPTQHTDTNEPWQLQNALEDNVRSQAGFLKCTSASATSASEFGAGVAGRATCRGKDGRLF